MFTDSVGLEFGKGAAEMALPHSTVSGASAGTAGAGTSGPAIAGIVPAGVGVATAKRASRLVDLPPGLRRMKEGLLLQP